MDRGVLVHPRYQGVRACSRCVRVIVWASLHRRPFQYLNGHYLGELRLVDLLASTCAVIIIVRAGCGRKFLTVRRHYCPFLRCDRAKVCVCQVASDCTQGKNYWKSDCAWLYHYRYPAIHFPFIIPSSSRTILQAAVACPWPKSRSPARAARGNSLFQ